MTSIESTVKSIVGASTWDARVAAIRLVGENHGTREHQEIYAKVAREAYVPHLSPDFAYVHSMDYYDLSAFRIAYRCASDGTSNFTNVDEMSLKATILKDSRSLLALRTVTGLLVNEFATATKLVADPLGLKHLSASAISSMEKRGSQAPKEETREDNARVIALTLLQIMDGSLFGDPPGNLRSKQEKFDTRDGWCTVAQLARDGVPYDAFLHQRHYGGAYRQLLDATSSLRGDIIEDAVEELFKNNGIPYLRTGAHNQADIENRFGIKVTPAPDFVVFDKSDTLRAMLECKLVNDGGTARDKALRFERLRDESIRLNGVPLLAVLTGMGWMRVNDTLGPVVRDTLGRVFTLSTLPQMLDVDPFPSLIGMGVGEDS